MPLGSNSDAPSAAAAADGRARLDATIADFFLPDEARLDDRTRLALAARLADLVGAIESDLRRHAARLLAGSGDEGAAEALLTGDGAMERLVRSGVLRDPALMGELIASVRIEQIAERLALRDRPGGLLRRLIGGEDRPVAAAARALLAVAGRAPDPLLDLPAELQYRLCWWVAAAIRSGDAASDRTLAEAARRWLAAADEGERGVALALRLAAALEPAPAGLPALLVEALDDGRPLLFVALIGRATGAEAETVRALILDPAGDGLWWALRAVDTGRDDLARIGLALAEADPRRDEQRFADRLDVLAAMSVKKARARLAQLTLPADFRQAIDAVTGGAA